MKTVLGLEFLVNHCIYVLIVYLEKDSFVYTFASNGPMMNRTLPIILALVCIASLPACYEKIVLDDTNDVLPTFQLDLENQGDTLFNLSWTQISTSKFVRYVLVKSTAPIISTVQANQITFPAAVEKVELDPSQTEITARFGFVANQKFYFRVIVELTDRQFVSNQVELDAKNGSSFHFAMTSIQISQDFNRMCVFDWLKDSLHMIDIEQAQILRSAPITDKILAWCFGTFQNREVLFVSTSNKLARYDALTLVKENEVNISSASSCIMFIKDELVLFNTIASPKQIKVYAAENLSLLSTYTYATNESSAGQEPLYCNDADAKVFTAFTLDSGTQFKIKPNGSLELIKRKPITSPNSINVMRIAEYRNKEFIIGGSAILDSSLTNQYVPTVPNLSQVSWITYSETPKHYLMTTRSTTPPFSEFIHKREYSTDLDLVAPLRLDPPARAHHLYFERNGWLYWAGNDFQGNFNLAKIKF